MGNVGQLDLWPDDTDQHNRYRYRQAIGDDGGPLQPHHVYRYELIYRWDSGPTLEWIMLNPSTADQHHADPTIRRCITFAMRWGYACIVVRNLYAYRATSPHLLLDAADPIGPRNRAYLANNIADCTIAAWGASTVIDRRPALPLPRRAMHTLGLTRDGHPRHPLYVRSDATPIRFEVSS